MIDIDRMDQELSAALAGSVGALPARSPARARTSPSPAPAPEPRQCEGAAPATSSPLGLLELGLLEEADAAMTGAAHPRDALTWTTMRALLGGREAEAIRGVEEMRRLAERTDDPEARDRHWLQRFWADFEWGTQGERLDVLDHCRARAYRFDDVPWWGNLALLLAAMGKQDEAVRAFDAAAQLPLGPHALDVVTNLIEAAALLGDAGRVCAAFPALREPEGRLVVVGPGVVCKGSVDRYRALGLAALGRWGEAAASFRSAESTHRAIGAGPLLARTLQQASGSLVAA